MIYTSRFSNPTLKSGQYTAIRISVGMPRWAIGYEITGELRDLMPFGLRNVEDAKSFRPLYYARLERIGVGKIRKQLENLEALGQPVVLLCFEDIRQGDWNWCHRRIFADWWQAKTGDIIEELTDPSPVKRVKRNVMDSLF